MTAGHPLAVVEDLGNRYLVGPQPTPIAVRVAHLAELDSAIRELRRHVADVRARHIAAAVRQTSSVEVAAELGLSIASVAKAVVRARAVDA